MKYEAKFARTDTVEYNLSDYSDPNYVQLWVFLQDRETYSRSILLPKQHLGLLQRLLGDYIKEGDE